MRQSPQQILGCLRCLRKQPKWTSLLYVSQSYAFPHVKRSLPSKERKLTTSAKAQEMEVVLLDQEMENTASFRMF